MRESGLALVMVLWLIALMTVVAASFATQSKVESQLARNTVEALKARYLAESGFARAMRELMVTDSAQRWQFDGRVYALEGDDAVTRIAIRVSSGLVNLNQAPRDVLVKLFALISDEPEEREALADRLEDWRDADDLRRVSGAEDPDYRAAGYTRLTAGRDLNSLDELAYVMGFNAAKVTQLLPYITLNSKRSQVDQRYAPETLRTLLQQSSSGTASLGNALDFIEPDWGGWAGDPSSGSSGANKDYRVEVEVSTRQGARAHIQADVTLQSRPDQPYLIRYWRE
ncbi:MAG: PilX N-terminal domain-containing pilus assembly protein [Candidatus Thiodiazotropha sp.]